MSSIVMPLRPALLTACLVAVASVLGFATGTDLADAASALAALAPASAVPNPAATEPACVVPGEFTRLTYPLTHTARLLAVRQPIKIIAIGSSSTAGAGASSPMAAYPSRLAVELAQKFPGQKLIVLNRGKNGEEAKQMLARFDAGVIAEKPDLVLWQLGSNTVLRDHALSPAASVIGNGVAELRAAGADVILIDPQFAPRVIAKRETLDMVDLLEAKAEQYHVNLFRRFALMRYWSKDRRLPFGIFVSRDKLHMNDWGYACLAKALSIAIAKAATRPVASAAAQPAR
jgi:acyl-CoA thioesterase I